MSSSQVIIIIFIFYFYLFLNFVFRNFLSSVFLQYIERDVFTLDVDFVEKTVAELTNSEDDRLFKYELLSNLNNRSRSLEIMTKHEEYVEYPFHTTIFLFHPHEILYFFFNLRLLIYCSFICPIYH